MDSNVRIRVAFYFSFCALFLLVGCGIGTTTPNSPSDNSPQSVPKTSANYVFVENVQRGAVLHVLEVNADGTLQQVGGSPFAIPAQHLGIAGQYLIAGGTTIAAYKFDPSAGSITKSSGDVPGGEIGGNAQLVYVGAVNALYGYSLQGGQLVPVPGSPYGVVNDPCGCATPVYGTLTVAGNWVFYGVSAGHAGSSINAAHIASDGSITSQLIDGGSAPSAAAYVAPSGVFVFESSSGLGTLRAFPFDPSTGKVGTGTDTTVSSAALVFDSSSTLAFTQSSAGAGISSYRISHQSGALELLSTISAPNAFPNAVTSDGAYLLALETPASFTYAIGVYAINGNSGTLKKVSTYSLPPYSNDWAPSHLVVGTF